MRKLIQLFLICAGLTALFGSHSASALECPVFSVPVSLIETGLKGAEDGTREEAHT